ncbi:MAG TPA: S8 family serine peptidase [Kofleriaceae bacterium]|nr:S8 family serine peptidase [Kofleriaceae bacterium]
MKRLCFAIAVGLTGSLIGCGSGTPTDDDDQVQLPPSAVTQIEGLLAEKAARTPAQQKISSQLLYAARGTFANALAPTKDPAKQITSLSQTDARGRVLVDIKGDVSDGQIQALGGVLVGTSTVHHSTRAWLPLDRLEELAGNATVRAIRPALAATTDRAGIPGGHPKFSLGTQAERVAAMQQASELWQGPATLATEPHAFASTGARTSEGVTAHGVERARKQYNVDGTGVTIGVLSDSDDHREQSILTGDLPASTITIPGQDGRPGAGEGTAMMEIVHDMAPGANLVFATAFNGPDVMADNIRRLRFEYHCDVIVDDVIYFFESPYQDDIIAQAVEDVVADGAVYVSSAGNEGNQNDGTSGTWEGDFKDAGTLATLPSGYTIHNFGDKTISDRIEQQGGPLILHWSDPGTLDAPMSSNDYDLFVLDNDLRNVVVAATDLQDGAGMPFEYLGYNLPPGFRVVVARHPNAETRAIRVALFRGELGLSTSGGTYGHSAAANALGAAAVDAAEAAGGEFTAGPTTPVELFSSDGNRRVFYNRDGSPIKADKLTFASNGGEQRLKPDLAGADGVQTTLPPETGLEPFYGTSAAAPHIAAIAGLIKSAVPAATSTQIRNALKTGALDIEGAGTDRDSGAGIAFAPDALKKAGAKAAVFLEQNSVTLTPTGSDAVLPGGSAQLRVQLINNGLAKATAVNATLSSSSPYVTVTQPTSTYPNVFPGATATNPIAFAFTADAATPCGAQLPLSLTINYTGIGPHPTVLPLTVQVGRPGATTVTSFVGSPVAIPDGVPSGVDIPLAVSATGPLASLRFSIDGSACTTDPGATTVGIDHTWVGDLHMTLVSPSGRAVTVIDGAGGAMNFGHNFCQTLIDDAAPSSIQTVTPEMAPFTGWFKPANPLSAFIGEETAGTWTLHVMDSFPADGGNVRAFSLVTSGFSCTP